MFSSRLAVNTALLLVAVIWGFGFVPQKLGMDYVGPAAFNALRFSLGALTLLPVILFWQRKSPRPIGEETFRLGLGLGVLLFFGALLQQKALLYTSVANVAFITGLYVIIVPMIGFFIGLRYALIVWSGGIIAIVGLYLMTGGSTDTSLKGDIIALMGAIMWALHIMLLARKAGDHPQVPLAALQFVFCAALSLVFALITEPILFPSEPLGFLWPVVNGVIVVGFAYTLQVVVMDKAEPFQASIIFSLEAVFGAIAGYWVFSESFTLAALLGAGLMLIGCLLAQVPENAN